MKKLSTTLFAVLVGTAMLAVSTAYVHAGTYEDLVLADSGLVAYFQLGEAVGSLTAADSAANPLVGSVGSAVTFGAAGIPGASTTAAALTAQNIGIKIADPGTGSKIDFGLGSYTFEAWMKSSGFPEGITQMNLIKKRSSTTYTGLHLTKMATDTPPWTRVDSLNKGSAGLDKYLTVPEDINVTDGHWHHIVGARDAVAGKMALYIDGSHVVSTNTAYFPSNADNNSYLGLGYDPFVYGGVWYNALLGTLDEVALYKRALSASDVATHYQTGIVPETSTLALLCALGLMIAMGFGRRVSG